MALGSDSSDSDEDLKGGELPAGHRRTRSGSVGSYEEFRALPDFIGSAGQSLSAIPELIREGSSGSSAVSDRGGADSKTSIETHTVPERGQGRPLPPSVLGLRITVPPDNEVAALTTSLMDVDLGAMVDSPVPAPASAVPERTGGLKRTAAMADFHKGGGDDGDPSTRTFERVLVKRLRSLSVDQREDGPGQPEIPMDDRPHSVEL